MRNIVRGLAAVALVFLLSTTPVAGATRPSGSSTSVLQSIKRFVVRVASRISPPIGVPAPPPPEDPTTQTTAQPTKAN